MGGWKKGTNSTLVLRLRERKSAHSTRKLYASPVANVHQYTCNTPKRSLKSLPAGGPTIMTSSGKTISWSGHIVQEERHSQNKTKIPLTDGEDVGHSNG